MRPLLFLQKKLRHSYIERYIIIKTFTLHEEALMKFFMRIIFCSFISYFCGVTLLHAATMTVVQYPKDGTNDAALQTALDVTVASANTQLALFKNQSELAKGFADANAFSSHSATLQGFQNYDLFAVGVGFMAGVQAPSTDPNYYKNSKIEDDIRKDGDISAGVSTGVSLFAGIHARFISPYLYLSIQAGKLDIGDAEESYRFKNTIYGFGINYGLFMPRSILLGFLKWRGISLGTGLIYQHNEVNFEIELDPISQSVTGPISLTLDPTVNFGFDVTTYTIPVEAVTSFQFLWILNISTGIGADIIYGSSDLLITSAGTVSVSGTTLTQNGIVEVDGSTKDVSPSKIRPKIMAGIGLNILLVKIEIPVVYYPESGAAVGLTASVVF